MSIKDAYWDYLVGSTSITNLVDLRVYDRVSPGYATGLLTVTVNPADTKTVTIDDVVYTFQTSLTNVDGNVQIGANIDASLDNLVGAIQLTGVAGTDYALSQTRHPTALASRPLTGKMEVMAKSISRSGDLDTTETLDNGSWGQTTMNIYPYIVLTRLDAPHVRSMDGGAGLANPTFQTDCAGLTGPDSESVADAVFALVQGKDSGTIGTPSVTLEEMTATMDQDLYDSPIEDEEVGVFRQLVMVSMWHRESVPSP